MPNAMSSLPQDRKRTLVDELIADAEFRKYNKRKYREIIQDKSKTQPRSKFRGGNKKKKQKQEAAASWFIISVLYFCIGILKKKVVWTPVLFLNGFGYETIVFISILIWIWN